MKRKINIPHTFTIVFFIVIISAITTWFVPGGELIRNEQGSNVFKFIDSVPQTWQIFTAFFKGFEKNAYIIVFILILGGTFWILNHTKAINIGIVYFLNFMKKLKKYSFFRILGIDNIIIVLIMLLFSLFGSIFGMSEETIPFILIFVPLAISMGYDSIVGVLMCYVAAHTGFAGAMLNPFTVGIAQGLSGLPTFSGIEYRTLCWLILTIIAIVFTLIYAHKIKKNPQNSIMYEIDNYWRTENNNINHNIKDDNINNIIVENKKSTFSAWIIMTILSGIFLFCFIKLPTTVFKIGNSLYTLPFFPVFFFIFILFGFYCLKKSVYHFILMLLGTTIIILIVGVIGYGWYVKEIAALFLGMGISVGISFNITFDKVIRLFIEGCKDIMNAALIVGMAGGIIIILEDGKIMDTLLYYASQAINTSGREFAITSMYVIQNLLNIIIPSGTAKAALTIPLMSELSEMVNISKQLTVLAFQFGDGFTNMITPTSGVLIGCLGVAKIPYAKWFKFILPFVIILIIVGYILLQFPLYFNGF